MVAARRNLLSAAALVVVPLSLSSAAHAQTAPNLVGVCSGVSLPRSAVTDTIAPVIGGIVTPVQATVNPILGVVGAALPLVPPLSIDAAGLLASAAAGAPIGLSVLNTQGQVVGPNDRCDAQATSFTVATPAGVSIGGNAITGLGTTGQEASAGTLDSVAIGDRAVTAPDAAGAVALGAGARVGAGATGSLALGTGAIATGPSSVGLGSNSVANRGVPEISVGAPGAERLVTNVAAGTAPTDAANVGQLNAVAGTLAGLTSRAVVYDTAARDRVTLGGAGGTVLTNVAPGVLAAGSTDAVNGAQLAATNARVDALGASVAANTLAITNLQGGGAGPVRYADPGAPTQPNAGAPTNDATLAGGAPGAVAVRNVAAGLVAAGSTDAINGGQLAATQATASNALAQAGAAQATAGNALAQAGAAQATAGNALMLAQGAVQYDAGRTAVTLAPGAAPVAIRNVAAGTAPTDGANVGQVNAGLADAVARSTSYTDAALAGVTFDLRNSRREMNAGTATALAAAGLPQAIAPGASMIAIGGGTYGGQSAIAIGFSRVVGDRVLVKLAGSRDTRGRTGASGGVGLQF